MIGVVNLANVDTGNPADYRVAQHLLGTAANRIQRALFDQPFGDALLVAVAASEQRDVLRRDELLAVDEAGTIIGSTTGAHRVIGLGAATDLIGQTFEGLFSPDVCALDPGAVECPVGCPIKEENVMSEVLPKVFKTSE